MGVAAGGLQHRLVTALCRRFGKGVGIGAFFRGAAVENFDAVEQRFILNNLGGDFLHAVTGQLIGMGQDTKATGIVDGCRRIGKADPARFLVRTAAGPLQKQPQQMPCLGGILHGRDQQNAVAQRLVKDLLRRAAVVIADGQGADAPLFCRSYRLGKGHAAVGGVLGMQMQIHTAVHWPFPLPRRVRYR